MNKKELLSGIIPPMITPLSKEGNVDLESSKNVVDYLIEGKVNVLFILGTTGEGPLISLNEQVKFAEAVVKHTAERVPVIAGISSPSTAGALKVGEKLSSIGVDAFVSTLPFYDNTNTEEQIRHFKILAENLDLPIIIYDIPSKVGQELSDKALMELVKHKNIIGLKDSSSNIRHFRERIEAFSEYDFMFALGHSDMIDISVYLGANGVVPSDAHLFPELCSEIYKNSLNNNFNKAKALQQKLNKRRIDLYNKYPENKRNNNKVCKNYLKKQGIISDDLVMAPYF